MKQRDRTLVEWFQEAELCYLEKHQACPWCGIPNSVYRWDHGRRLEYQCGGCSFYSCHDIVNEQYLMAPGQRRPGEKAPATMHEI